MKNKENQINQRPFLLSQKTQTLIKQSEDEDHEVLLHDSCFACKKLSTQEPKDVQHPVSGSKSNRI